LLSASSESLEGDPLRPVLEVSIIVYVKRSSWPAVLPNDEGIRPAGKPDQCFYCGRRVGQSHVYDCVTVTSLVRFAVLLNGTRMGHYDRHSPHHWTTHDREFQLNEGSWCASNAMETIVWDAGEPPLEVAGLDLDEDGVSISGGCAYLLLEFREEQVLDVGPFIETRDEDSTAPASEG
jgi:hypothetical protein